MDRDSIYLSAIDYIENKFKIKLYAALAYGSRVAGYSSKHSDYDMIMIAEGFREGIRYVYEKFDGDNYVSALLVDRGFFEEDVEYAKHGEFVSGRLFTVFYPLKNSEYIYDMEVRLKKRTTIEETCLLLDKFGGLAYDLIIPIKYFLLSRLRWRLIAYPPVRYSYSKMFFGNRGRENLDKVLEGFYKAVEELESEGLLSFVDDHSVKILKRPKTCLGGLKDWLLILKRGAKHYITHGRSAKVKPIVVAEEAISKIKRELKGFKLPDELTDPEILLKMSDMYFSYKALSPLRSVKILFGGKAYIKKVVKRGLLSDLYELYVEDEEGNLHVVIMKRYSPLYLFKWFFIQLWLLDVKRFILWGRKRFLNEFIMLRELSSIGLNCPSPKLFSWSDTSLYIDYIKGERIIDLFDNYEFNFVKRMVREWGKIIGYLHSRGITLGDTKPHNAIIRDNKIFIVDLEQARVDDNFAWDVAEALYYSFIWPIKFAKIGLENIVSSFVEGYLKYGKFDALIKATSLRYIRPFLPLVPPNRIYKIRRLVRTISYQSNRILS